MWTADGSQILYDFGSSFWYEGTTLSGGSLPWIVSAAGGAAPASFPTELGCSVIHPARNPATGEFLLIHACACPGKGAVTVSTSTRRRRLAPEKLLASAHVDGNVDVFLENAKWISDGSGSLFIGGTSDTNWKPSLLAYDMKAGTVSSLVVLPQGSTIYSVAISPDASKIVYCLRNDDDSTEDLHLIDVDAASPTDTAITTDGKSCYPSF